MKRQAWILEIGIEEKRYDASNEYCPLTHVRYFSVDCCLSFGEAINKKAAYEAAGYHITIKEIAFEQQESIIKD